MLTGGRQISSNLVFFFIEVTEAKNGLIKKKKYCISRTFGRNLSNKIREKDILS